MANSQRAFPRENVRCCTIIGHIDHGKTTFADSLLAANGIISSRMAGKLRFLDAREDEQERGITMEASAVSLMFKLRQHSSIQQQQPSASSSSTADAAAGSAAEPIIQDYMINLIDTPGHVDFSSEVSTASRLCDGTLVIVDVIEGVCTQTIAVLKQAWHDRLKPILVLNKMDRLVTELRLTPHEAYHHLMQVIEQVNAVMGSFFSAERMDDDLRWHEEREKRIERKKAQAAEQNAAGATVSSGNNEDDDDGETAYEEHDDEDIYFDPARGNVIFASAVDNWAFRLDRFSVLYAKKLGIQERKFRKVLWGDFYFDPKNKRVISHKQKEKEKRNLKPMFVQFVLDNIWSVYDSVVLNKDQEKVEKIVKALDLRIPQRDIRAKDPSTLLVSIFSQWLPLAACTFSAVVSNTPSPADAQKFRLPKMLRPDLPYFATPSEMAPKSDLERDLFEANAGPDAQCVAYVSKMFAVKREELPEMRRAPLTAEEMRRIAKEQKEKAAAAGQAAVTNGVDLETARATNGSESEKEAPPTPPAADLNVSKPDAEAPPASPDVLIGFARLYSGTLRRGDSIYALLPKYNTSLPRTHPANARYISSVKAEAIYMIMGRDLASVPEVPAGNVFGIRGLEGHVLRNATLCSARSLDAVEEGRPTENREEFVNLAGVNMLGAPIVRVALEPVNPSDMPKLVHGLKLLNQADPCAETYIQETGEHVLAGAGELHLERCLRDLRERFAKCEIQASAPLVPFRETAIKAAEMPPPKNETGAPRGTITSSVAGGLIRYAVRAAPLPADVTRFLLANATTIRRLLQDRERRHPGGSATGDATPAVGASNETQGLDGESGEDLVQSQSVDADGPRATTKDKFWNELEALFAKAGPEWAGAADQIWSFGPKRVGANILVDRADLTTRRLRDRTDPARFDAGDQAGHRAPESAGSAQLTAHLESALQQLNIDGTSSAEAGISKASEARHVASQAGQVNESIDSGFQIATHQGPLCAEPVQGLAYFVESLQVDKDEASKEGARAKLSQAAGSLISSFREACRNGLLDWSPRIMLAMYSCDIQASTEVLGKVHAVLSKRRGRITSEEMKEGTSFFTVGSVLPVVESFGFADEIRKRTSGAASPQLIFKGFELFDLDPFWVPRTEEELEDLGEKGDRENVAKRYVDAVRKRKGMFVTGERIVEAAEKQRNLKSN
ncbi:Cytoplasmic GTPase/eEF2-like protein (ribosomal biogenesis) [Tilletia horrida]|uniref:Ribosome assembly protein 1 n=1 Tax=Tilletia horrida TaxID=155126 RepID=A0AAN6GLC3_9BASI|nr:Cytoplasmic GTPase/eEF2-like protein (ribosomal biogenesis) [Tilletia horrida]